MSLRAWPRDQLEHELRSLRRFLRQFPECPDEVRINDYEGTFIRPSIRIVPVTAAASRSGASTTLTRSITIAWFGSESDDQREVEYEARAVASWLVNALTVGDTTKRRTIRVYDFSTPNNPQETRRGLDVDYASISATTLRDDVGLYSVAVDFRYQVRTDIPIVATTLPTVTSVTSGVATDTSSENPPVVTSITTESDN